MISDKRIHELGVLLFDDTDRMMRRVRTLVRQEIEKATKENANSDQTEKPSD